MLFFVPAFAVSLTGLAHAETILLTLTDALKRAQQENVQVVVAKERVQQALARVGESSSVFLPQIAAGISQMRQTRDLRTAGISVAGDPLVGPFNTYDARISLTQNLFDLSVIERLKAARKAQDVSLAEYRKTQQDVLALAAILFINAQRAQQNQNVAKAFLKRDVKNFRIVKTRLRQGLGSSLDVQQARFACRKSLSMWRSARTRALQTRLDLDSALLIPENQDIVFVEEEILEYPSSALKEVNRALLKHPDVEVERQKWQQAQTLHAVEKAGYFPKISGVADYGESGIKPRDANETYAFGVQASMPIFEGGLRGARLKETESVVREQEATWHDVERNVRARAFTVIETVRQTRLQMKEKEDEVAVWEHELNLDRRRFHNGEGSSIDYLNTWAQVLAAKDQREEAKATYQLAHIQLAHAMGEMEKLLGQE